MRGVYIMIGMLVTGAMIAQPADRLISTKDYIDTYKEDAVREMIRSGVPASITLAQGILESGSGNSPLAKYGKNHFGIKCHKGWTGKSMRLDDDKPNECFRKYKSVDESFRDHSDFLSGKKRYAGLFELRPTDYKGWAKGLKSAGYATNPKYADLLIDLIERYELYDYDRFAKLPPRKLKSLEAKRTVIKKKKRTVKVHENRIKYTIARSGDSFYKIANDFEMGLWQILKYNDLNKRDILQPGDIIYLQPKRKRARDKYHTVMKGETMREISQYYGINLKSLYRKNKMIRGTEPRPGQKLHLRRAVRD